MHETIDDGVISQVVNENTSKSADNIFRSEQVNFLKSKIELIRNKYVFERIDYESIIEITINDGYLIKNRWVIRGLSIVVIYFLVRFMFFGLSANGGIGQWNLAQWFNKGSLISLWGPLFVLIGATIALYQSFIKSPVFTIRTNDKRHIVRVKNLEENKTLDELVVFLKTKETVVSDERKVKPVGG